MTSEILSSEWCEAVNHLLADHDTGTVPEFSIVVQIRVDEWKMSGRYAAVRISNSRLSFSTERGDEIDAWVDLPESIVKELMLSGTGSAGIVNRLGAGGGLRFDGDTSKLNAFQDGVIRGGDEALVQRIAAVTA